MVKYRYIAFLFVFIFIVNFSALGQGDLRPPMTKMISSKIDEPEGAVITYYQYESKSSKKEILKFYRLLFKNRGFKELKGRGSSKDFFFFGNQDEGIMVTLVFLLSERKSVVRYSLTNHHLTLLEEKSKP